MTRSPSPQPSPVALVSTVLAGVIAVLVLLSYAVGRADALTFGPRWVPMAPSTAAVVLAFALTLGVSGRRRIAGRRPGLLAAGWLLLLVCAVLGTAEVLGTSVGIERFMQPIPDVFRHWTAGMSRWTAAQLGMLAVALIARAWPARAGVDTQLGGLTVLTSGLLLEGYVLGGPALYGSTTIPVALLTTVAVLALSVSIVLTSGTSAELLAALLGGEGRRAAGLRPLTWLLVTLVLVGGLFTWRGRQAEEEAAALRELAVLAELKVGQITEWLDGRRSTARAIEVTPGLERVLRQGDTVQLQRWLTEVAAANRFVEAAIFDPDGRTIVAVGSQLEDHQGELAQGIQQQGAGGEHDIVFQDVHAHGDVRRLAFWIPIVPEGDSLPSVWVMVAADPDATLFPTISRVTGGRPSTEVVVWRQTGDTLVMLNDPDPTTRSSLLVRRVIDASTGLPRALSRMQGDTTLTDLPDYRGTRAIGAARRVPGTSWILITKVSEAEVTGPVRRATISATLVALVLVLSLSALLTGLWSRQRLQATTRELALVRAREASVAELAASEARYARAMGATSDGLWDWDMRSDRVYHAPRWYTMFGLSDDRAQGPMADAMARVHPSDRARVDAAMEALRAGSGAYDIEYRMAHADGHWVWVRDRSEAFRDASGLVVRMTGALSDITAQRELEDALRRTERVLRVRSAVNRAVVRATDEGTLLQAVCDVAVTEGQYVMAWIGYAEEAPGRPVSLRAAAGRVDGYLDEVTITWDAEAPSGQGPTGRCLRLGQAQVAQDLHRDPKFAPFRAAALARGFASSCSIPLTVRGRTIGALMLYSPEPFAFDTAEVGLLSEVGDDLSYGIGATRDSITLAAQQSELLIFREILDRSTDAIFVVDAATQRFVDVNQGAVQSLGYTRDELLTMGPADVVVRMTEPGALPGLVEFLRTQGPSLQPSEHRRKDGSTFPVEVALALVQLGGRELLLGVARDVSDRNALQQQLLQSQKIEGLGRLAGGIAHDFNNLLTVINATTDLVLQATPEGDPRRTDLAEVRAAGSRAAELTGQLLAFSRRQVLKREVLDLGDTVRAFAMLLRRVIGEDITLDLQLPSTALRVSADPGQLEQIIMNLVVNARDAMPDGGRLQVEVSEVQLDAAFTAQHPTTQEGPHGRLRVRDTGTGMPAEVLEKVFEPFFTTKPPGKGTGLGLATVYGLVKAMDGSVWITSTEGVGTSVDVYFPVVTAAAAASPPEVAVEPSSGHETVLVVEDEPAIRVVARRVLERAGYAVQVAPDAQEALRLLESGAVRPDLLLTDIVMPGMSGNELARVVHERWPAVRILLTSGYSSELLAERARGPGSWPLLGKPYTMNVLLAEVRRVLEAPTD
jgi:PAS domain S-box-containing protein